MSRAIKRMICKFNGMDAADRLIEGRISLKFKGCERMDGLVDVKARLNGVMAVHFKVHPRAV